MSELAWSNRIRINNGQLEGEPLLTFRPLLPLEPFLSISRKLAQLTDYCHNQVIASKNKLDELRRENTELIISCDNPFTLESASEEIDNWAMIVNLYSQSVPVVLLMSFLEWSLKLILKEYTGDVPRKPKNTKLSDVEFYIQQISKNQKHTFNIESTIMEKISVFRDIRNHFAHGEWDKVENLLAKTGLRDGFCIVSKLLEIIYLEIHCHINQ